MLSRLQTETRAGDPIKAGKFKIIPFSQSVRLGSPRFNGGVIWNRPVSVLAISPEGEETVIPVPDITRRIQLTIIGSGLLSVFMIWMVSRITQTSKRGYDG